MNTFSNIEIFTLLFANIGPIKVLITIVSANQLVVGYDLNAYMKAIDNYSFIRGEIIMNETLFQLLLAVIIGGLIGAEREFRTGTGLRTLMLICLGATLFTIYSDIFSFGEGDPRRIAASVVTGVGFLGAGMILRQQGGIIGLTTAASVWLVAALGMGIGIGQYLIVAVASVLVLLILWAIPLLQRVTRARETLTYNVLTPLQMNKYPDLQEILKIHDLQVTGSTIDKEKDGIRYLWQAYGKPERHRTAMQAIINEDYVQEFHTR